MSTTPEDNKAAAEGQPAVPAQPAAAPTTPEPGPGKSRPNLCKIVGGGGALLVLVLVVLHFVNQSSERARVFGETRPLDEVTGLRATQQQFLDGNNPTGKSLEQAMAEALRR